jgi:hypothetical protein
LIPTDVLKYAKTAAYFGILMTEFISFNTSVYETKASPIEELDLLIRYLGKSSSRQVSSIKTSNPGNLKLGLEKVHCPGRELYYYVVGLEYHNGHKNDHSHCFGKAL